MSKITFKRFPVTKKSKRFKRVLREGYRRLITKHNVIIELYDKGTMCTIGWCVKSVHNVRNSKMAEIGASKNTVLHDIKNGWTRGALHELCHIKLMEIFRKESLSDTIKIFKQEENLNHNDIMFEVFVSRTSPEGFTEFLVDELYMQYFPEPEYKKWFKPEVTGSIQKAFDALQKTKKNDCRSFSNLFYLIRCNYTAKKYGESRPTYQRMVNKLEKYKRYTTTIYSLNKVLESWRFPDTIKALNHTISQLYNIYKSFIGQNDQKNIKKELLKY